MRRTILFASVLALAVAMLAPPARAQEVTHFQVTFEDHFVVPAGDGGCEFPVAEDYTANDNGTVFGNPENPTKAIDRLIVSATHTNLDTGYWLSDEDVIVYIWTAGQERVKSVGLQWNLRTPDGERVFQGAGQIVYDAVTGEVLSFTPHSGGAWTDVACPLLAG